MRCKRPLNARLEAALLMTRAIELHQSPQVTLGNRLPIRPAGQCGNDPTGARSFCDLLARTTDKNPTAARRLAWPCRVERTRDGQRGDVRGACRIERIGRTPQKRLQGPRVRHGRSPHKSHANLPWSRLYRHANLQPCVDRIRRRHRPLEPGIEVAFPADGKDIHTLAIHGELDLVRNVETARAVGMVTQQLDSKKVLAVKRKCMADENPADGPQRQSINVAILRTVLTNPVGLRSDSDVSVPDGKRADPTCGGQIALYQDGRHP